MHLALCRLVQDAERDKRMEDEERRRAEAERRELATDRFRAMAQDAGDV